MTRKPPFMCRVFGHKDEYTNSKTKGFLSDEAILTTAKCKRCGRIDEIVTELVGLNPGANTGVASDLRSFTKNPGGSA